MRYFERKRRALLPVMMLAAALCMSQTVWAAAGPGGVKGERTAQEVAAWAEASGYAVISGGTMQQGSGAGPGGTAGPGGGQQYPGGQTAAVTDNQNTAGQEQAAQPAADSAAGAVSPGAGPAFPTTAGNNITATQGPDGAAAAQAEAAAQAQAAAQAEAAAQAQAAAQAAAGGQPRIEGNLLYSGGRTIDITKPMIALTYDDGPQTAVGNRIMNIFGQYGQRCTFFMVGDRVPSRADEVRRMANEGFELANHTYSHTYLNRVDAATIRKQVTSCNDIIEQTTGIRPTIMRLPGGNKNDTVLKNVNMPIILWNVDTRDWDHRNTQKTIDKVMGKVKDGDIVLMHELYDSTAAATEAMVPALVNQGFQLVTVTEMAVAKGIQLVPNKVYYSF